jgi:hypothetical protein
VSFAVNDGSGNSNTVTSTVNITSVNDAPVLATGSTLGYTENGAASAINTAITVADPDNGTLSSATVSITGGLASAEDTLSFTNVPATMGNIAGSYNAGTGVMTLTSAGNTATVAQWQAALRAVQYSNSSDNPSTAARTVTYQINDSAANSNTVTSTVNVTAVNDASTLATGSTLNYTENGAASAINTAFRDGVDHRQLRFGRGRALVHERSRDDGQHRGGLQRCDGGDDPYIGRRDGDACAMADGAARGAVREQLG